MTLNKTSFIELAIRKNVLKFGDFLTKAGRKSPYFFNLGAFDDGDSLKLLGQFYANIIIEKNINFDMLYGPAYKILFFISSENDLSKFSSIIR